MRKAHAGAYASLLEPGKPTVPLATQERLPTCILHVVPITTHTPDRRKSIGKKKQRKEKKTRKEKTRKRKTKKERKEEKRKYKKNKKMQDKRKQGSAYRTMCQFRTGTYPVALLPPGQKTTTPCHPEITTYILHSTWYLFFRTLVLSSFWTSRGHRCRPFPPPVLAFIFIAHSHKGSAIPLLVDFSSSVANSRSLVFCKSICAQEKVPTTSYDYALGGIRTHETDLHLARG